jgi:hypothetical protein
MLKGIPKSLLEKIRQKQAVKTLDTMIRIWKKLRSSTKEFLRWPDMSVVCITKKKGVLLMEVVLTKIQNSYRGGLTIKRPKNTCELLPSEIRNEMYIRMARKRRNELRRNRASS